MYTRLTDPIYRVKLSRMFMATWIFLHPPCYQKVHLIFQVSYRLFISQSISKKTNFILVKGIAKIARKFGIDYADAVVSSFIIVSI